MAVICISLGSQRAERCLEELRSEVAIGIEDIQPVASTTQQEGQKSPSKGLYIEMVNSTHTRVHMKQ